MDNMARTTRQRNAAHDHGPNRWCRAQISSERTQRNRNERTLRGFRCMDALDTSCPKQATQLGCIRTSGTSQFGLGRSSNRWRCRHHRLSHRVLHQRRFVVVNDHSRRNASNGGHCSSIAIWRCTYLPRECHQQQGHQPCF